MCYNQKSEKKDAFSEETVKMDKEVQNANGNDFDYTIVMDASYVGPDVRKAETPEADNRAITDRLYDEYEQMCRRMSAVFDADDLYPHSYP